MKLRFDIKELALEICNSYRAKQSNMIQIFDNKWETPEWGKIMKTTTKQKYFKSYEENNPEEQRSGHQVSYHATAKGYTVFFKTMLLRKVRIPMSVKTISTVMNGYSFKLVKNTVVDKMITITKDGKVYVKMNGKSLKRLTPMYNLIPFPEELYAKLVTLNCNQEWLYDHLIQTKKTKVYHLPNNEHKYSLNLFQSCSNLQQFINTLNQTTHPFSAKDFIGMSIPTIITIMKLANNASNPEKAIRMYDYLIGLEEFGQNSPGIFNDYWNMASQLNKKVRLTTNPRKLKVLHDDMIQEFLLTQEPKPIKVHKSVDKLYPLLPASYEVITDANRLKAEGLLLKHCVASYDYRINQGSCFIVSTVDKDNLRYTAELGINRDMDNFFYLTLNQFRGKYNKEAPNHLRLELIDIIEAFNKEKVPINYRQSVSSDTAQEEFDAHYNGVW